MRILGLIAALSTLLAACGERREDPPAAPANPADTPVNQSAEPANQSDAPVEQNDTAAAGANAAEAQSEAKAAEAEGKGAARTAEAAATASPCLVQDGKALSAPALRAVGTEPFWGARVEGRCVTYSHMEDQKGTRIWTRFTPAPGGGAWSGTLGGKSFELRIRPQRGCSDGMSDKRFPLAADLIVGGEKRSGCAEPL